MQRKPHSETGCWCSHSGDEHYPGRAGLLSCHSCEQRAMLEESYAMRVPVLEQRRHQRVNLPQPLRTSVAGIPAHVVDASIGGVGVMHHKAQLDRDTRYHLLFYSQYGPIKLECEFARTSPNQTLGGAVEEGAWRTGLKIVSADPESAARLRHLVMANTEH